VLEGVLTELMFKIPSDSTVEKVIISEDTVRLGKEPIVLRNPSKEARQLTASSIKNA